MYVCMYVCIYIERERGRERERDMPCVNVDCGLPDTGSR